MWLCIAVSVCPPDLGLLHALAGDDPADLDYRLHDHDHDKGRDGRQSMLHC